MKIYIYPKNSSDYLSTSQSYEITSYITNEVNEQKRSDDAFAITTFKVFLPENAFGAYNTKYVKFNIAPFTIFEIAPNNEAAGNSNNKRFFGYSKCTKYLRTQNNNINYYVHDITLLDPLVALEAMQVGTKTFTNHDDLEYLNQLSTIKNNAVSFSGSWAVHNYSYSFDKGATVFEIANEIFKMNNYKMRASIIYNGSYVYNNTINVTPVDLNNIPTIAINENKLTLVEYNQSQDDYCNYLESQVDNVVDRNTVTLFSNLCAKSNENIVKDDNCYIELPAKVESIEKFFAYTQADEQLEVITTQDAHDAVIIAYPSQTEYSYYDLLVWCSWLADLMTQLEAVNPNFSRNNMYFIDGTALTGAVGFIGYNRNANSQGKYYSWFDITPSIKDEDIYQALTPAEQTKYCFYRSGDNKIDGIFKYYKADWINTITGASSLPMLNHCFDAYTNKTFTSNVSTGYGGYCRINYLLENQLDNPLDVIFKVLAHPITNQYVRDRKTITAPNAVNWGYSRSYGNSANFIDYDIMRKNISISNSYLGTPELTLQFFDDCSLTENCKFSYDGETWYVMSIVMRITREHIIYTVNATTNYNKVADAIGVRTQYEATKIALDYIKERPLYYENNSTLSLYSDLIYYLRLELGFNDGITSNKSFMLPISFYSASNGVTCVSSVVDNYSAGTYLTNGHNSEYIVKDFNYTDTNAEVYKIVSMKIVAYADNQSIAVARGLPNVPSTAGIDVLTVTTNQIIHKDEHESLSFTIYLPNASLN